MIEITHLRYRSLHIEHLEFPIGKTTVIGKNGSGKTALLRLCAGVAEPDEGSITICGKSPRETDCGWVNEFPDRNILFLRVFDEIASPLRFRHHACEETESAVNAIAEHLGITPLLSRNSCELSGGEKVLVSFAAALVHAPELLVLDEYDSHLDHGRCMQIERAISSSGCKYVIQCTQQMDTAARSDYLIMLDRGIPVHAGTPEQVFSRLIDTPYYPHSWRLGG